MKKLVVSIIVILISLTSISAQNLMPYTMGESLSMNMSEAKTFVKDALTNNDFEILGSYKVANDQNRWMYAVTSQELKSIVNTLGGKRGYFSALRVGITIEDGKAIVSYTTPEYWGNAYLRADYTKVSGKIAELSGRFSKSFSMNKPFGSSKGKSVKKLKKYHYMMGMPYFDDDVTLGSFASYSEAVQKIDKNLSSSSDLTKVYEVSFADKQIKLYGVAIKGANGESKFLPIIDKSSPKHTAFLPYELLVYKNEAYMLHGRFRIALAFPDLTMGTFMKIMSAPGDIENALKAVCK